MSTNDYSDYGSGISSISIFTFYFPFTIVLIAIYRNSILPGSKVLIGNEVYIILMLSLMYLLVTIDFEALLRMKINFIKGYSKYIFLLFVLGFVSTILFNFQEILIFRNFVRLIVLFLNVLMYFWILPKFILSNWDYFESLVLTICYFSIGTAIIGFLMILFNIDAGKPGQLVSFVGHPNDVAVIFNSGVLSTFFYIDWKKEKLTEYKKVFYYISIFIQLLASLLTYTRAGYIGLGAALMLYLLLKYRKKFLFFLPILLSIALIIIPPFFKAKGFGSFVARLYLLIPAYSMMTKDNIALLWGYGTTNAFKEFLRYNMFNLANEEHLNNPHNVIASLILMYGILFTLVIVVYISLLLLKFIKKSLKSKNKEIQYIYSYIICFLVSYIFLSFFDSSVLMPEFYNIQIFLIFLGLLNYLSKFNLKYFEIRTTR